MTKTEVKDAIAQLPEEEQEEIAFEVLERLDYSREPTAEEKQLIEERLAEYKKNPEACSTWEEVKTRIWPGS